jgi:aspartyl/asparaginyl-tRNA synthetase
MAAQHAAAAAGPADVGDVKVARATGADARTVAEIWAQRAQLKEKTVTIRGKVVKFNENIMGKNWVHLRDGTGTAGKDNDVTVTTADQAAVGDVVTVKGTVRVDKDFGAGYAYPVIVEDARLTK